MPRMDLSGGGAVSGVRLVIGMVSSPLDDSILMSGCHGVQATSQCGGKCTEVWVQTESDRVDTNMKPVASRG